MIKKLLLLALSMLTLFSAITVVSAEDCMHDPIYERDWNAEVTTGVRVRDIPCMETSVVLTTLPVGEVVKVIGETDGYYKIRRADGLEGWVGQWLIGATDKSFSPDVPAPAPVPAPVVPEEPKEPLYDIKGHKYETAVRWMELNNIIAGYPDGSFKPDGDLNRAELVKIMSLTYSMFNESFDFASMKSENDIACFSDIKKGQWYTPYVCYSKKMGILEGYPDGEFKPERPVSRVEALKIVLSSLDFTVHTVAEKNYFDDTDINAWYAGYIEAANHLGFIEETSGNYYPGRNMLRGEVSNLVYDAYTYSKETAVFYN
jgi:S-layer homology domain/Bacterial SH3 domain